MMDYFDICCFTVFCYLPEHFRKQSIKKAMKQYVDNVGLYNDITDPVWNGNCWQSEMIVK
jgi:hypothetical protein